MIDPSVYIAHGAIVLGDVELSEHVSIWYDAVIHSDTDKISMAQRPISRT